MFRLFHDFAIIGTTTTAVVESENKFKSFNDDDSLQADQSKEDVYMYITIQRR